MNEEIDDSEFYHQDFTTATEWEVFIARIEEVLTQWKNEDEQLETDHIWTIKSEKITYVDFDFTLFSCRKNSNKLTGSKNSEETEAEKKNPIDFFYDFEYYDEKNQVEHSCLSTWYGINEFFVLSPSNNIGITSESKMQLLLSSLIIASNNIQLQTPIFVQIREKWQKLYLGVYEDDRIRTHFEMIHLKRGPPSCQYLNGLLEMFKGKTMSPFTLENIIISLQNTYYISEFGTVMWKQNIMESDNFDIENLFILPLGVTVDPINLLILKTTWNKLFDNSVVDSETFSDFDPMTAHKWSCRCTMTNEPVCLLADCLTEFLQNLTTNFTVYDILGDFASLPSSSDPNPFDVLTEPVMPSISSLLTRAARRSISGALSKRRGIPPITDSVLVPILYFLFPDADEKAVFPYDGKEDKEGDDEEFRESVSFNFLINFV